MLAFTRRYACSAAPQGEAQRLDLGGLSYRVVDVGRGPRRRAPVPRRLPLLSQAPAASAWPAGDAERARKAISYLRLAEALPPRPSTRATWPRCPSTSTPMPAAACPHARADGPAPSATRTPRCAGALSSCSAARPARRGGAPRRRARAASTSDPADMAACFRIHQALMRQREGVVVPLEGPSSTTRGTCRRRPRGVSPLWAARRRPVAPPGLDEVRGATSRPAAPAASATLCRVPRATRSSVSADLARLRALADRYDFGNSSSTTRSPRLRQRRRVGGGRFRRHELDDQVGFSGYADVMGGTAVLNPASAPGTRRSGPRSRPLRQRVLCRRRRSQMLRNSAETSSAAATCSTATRRRSCGSSRAALRRRPSVRHRPPAVPDRVGPALTNYRAYMQCGSRRTSSTPATAACSACSSAPNRRGEDLLRAPRRVHRPAPRRDLHPRRRV